ncbi:MAG: helix-turn-helix transcriptional regulator [Bacteroidota bacterium]
MALSRTVHFELKCDCINREEHFKKIAALVGDPVRAAIMGNLLEGRAFTATDWPGPSASNKSMHLSKLAGAGLLAFENQGRHRYYKFANKEIAYAIEAMTNLIPYFCKQKPAKRRDDPAHQTMQNLLLVGKTGVALTDSPVKQKLLIAQKNVFTRTDKAAKWFGSQGIDTIALQQQPRSYKAMSRLERKTPPDTPVRLKRPCLIPCWQMTG